MFCRAACINDIVYFRLSRLSQDLYGIANGWQSTQELGLVVYAYIHMYIYIYVCIHIHMYSQHKTDEGELGRLPRKCVEEPWLEWILNGRKTFDGRLHRGFWEKVQPGQEFIGWSNKQEAVLRVTEKMRFRDYGEAFAALGKSLVPEGAETPAQAVKLYEKFPGNDTRTISDVGVVALGVVVTDYLKVAKPTNETTRGKKRHPITTLSALVESP